MKNEFIKNIEKRHKTDAAILADFQNDLNQLLVATGCTDAKSETRIKTVCFESFGLVRELTPGNDLQHIEIEGVKASLSIPKLQDSLTPDARNETPFKSVFNEKQATPGNAVKTCESILIENDAFRFECNKRASIKRQYEGEFIELCGNCSFTFNKVFRK